MDEIKNEVTQEVTEVQEESYKSGSMQYIDSREVAEIVEKKHGHLTRDIGRYIRELTQSNIGFTDFFIESSYKDASGKNNKCYLVTRKGCEFIAHKLTGEKGSIFTATYINRFHEMKDELAGGVEAMDALVDTVKEYMLYQEKRNEEQMELFRQQMEFSQKLMERLENLENVKTIYQDNPYSINEEGKIESRKKELYKLTARVAELCNNSHTRMLHQMYRTLEERLGIVLDSYKCEYRSETGRQNAGMIEVIAANDWLYEKAVDMNQFVIERKQIYG